MDRFHVVTGGPGSGKTSLLAALAADGLRHMPEAGRAIIRHQMRIGGDALPWGDREAFAAQMLGWEMRSHEDASAMAGPILFDRAMPDIAGYLRLCGLVEPPSVIAACRSFRYARRVFVAPHWPEIYVQDAERRQDQDEAEATCRHMIAVYREHGYEVVELPRTPVADRVRFVRAAIAD